MARVIRRRGDRDTRPLRSVVRAQLERFLAVSPDGRTIPELRAFLVTQRPASRDTIARVLHQLVAEQLVLATDEPKWRRLARAAAFEHMRPARRRSPARGLRGRVHVLYVPTPALQAHVRSWFLMAPADAAPSPSTPEVSEVA